MTRSCRRRIVRRLARRWPSAPDRLGPASRQPRASLVAHPDQRPGMRAERRLVDALADRQPADLLARIDGHGVAAVVDRDGGPFAVTELPGRNLDARWRTSRRARAERAFAELEPAAAAGLVGDR